MRIKKNTEKDFYAGKNILITGVSSGIGRALSLKLVDLGANVFGVSRNEERMCSLVKSMKDKSGKFMPFLSDISDYNNCVKISEEIKKNFNLLDVIINNAGVGHFMPFEKMDYSDYQYLINTNLMAPMHLTSLLLSCLKQSRAPRVINICSSGGFYGIPFRGIYCSAKAGLRVWSQALELELARYNIMVSWVIPGATKTDFFENTLGKAPQTHRIPDKIRPPELLAEKILKFAVNRKGELFDSLSSRAVYYLANNFPGVTKIILKKMISQEERHIYNK